MARTYRARNLRLARRNAKILRGGVAIEPRQVVFATPPDTGKGAIEGSRDKLPRDPFALSRRFNRRAETDHEKLDKLDSLDDLYNEMDRDAVIGASVQRLESNVDSELRFVGDADVKPDVQEAIEAWWAPDTRLRKSAIRGVNDAWNRGFRLLEMTWANDDAGRDMVDLLRAIDRDAFRLWEDGYGRPIGLELDVIHDIPEQEPGKIQMGSSPFDRVEITTADTEWDRYLFLTSPETSSRVAGDAGAYARAWPHWHLGIMANQWLRSGGERLGMPPAIATFAASELNPQGFSSTKDEVLEQLEEIQTHFRGVLPDGWQVAWADTGAVGMGQFFEMLLGHSRKMIELSITLETVSGGAEAQGTLGANVALLATTFGGLVRSQQVRTAGLIDRLNRRMVDANWGEGTAMPRAEWANPDPAKDAEMHNRVQQGITLGVIDVHEPWLREQFGAPPVDDDLIDVTGETKAKIEDAGLGVTPEAGIVAGQNATPEAILDMLDRVEEGSLKESAARTLLSSALPSATPETIEDMIQEAIASGADDDAGADDAGADANAGGSAPEFEKALSGAQITALQGIVQSVSAGTLAPEAARLLIGAGFPIAPSVVAQMVQAAVTTDLPEEERESIISDVDVVAASEPASPKVYAVCDRLRSGFSTLREKVTSGHYNAMEPAPIRSAIISAYRRAGWDKPRAMSFAEETRDEITSWLRVALDNGEDPVEVMDAVEAYYTDWGIIMEALEDDS